MICGNIADAARYETMNEELSIALDYLKQGDFSALETGPLELGLGVRVSLIFAPLKKHKGWEAHRKYADIHFCLEEGEVLSVSRFDRVKGWGGYDEERDIMFAPESADCSGISAVHLLPGDFAVTYPEDAHIAGAAFTEEKTVKKIVVKIPV